MKIAAGGDSVSDLSEAITDYLKEKGHEVTLFGAPAGIDADYVDAAEAVANAVASGQCEQGLLFCNTGTGVTINANKIAGVRAALCVDNFAAKIARLANNANVIVLSVRITGEMLAKEIIDTWLDTQPSDEPRRMNFHRKTDEIDKKYLK